MSAASVLLTPPSSPQPLEEEEKSSISNECHKNNNAQQNETKTPQTPPSTPPCACDNVELHVTENDKSATDGITDHQAEPPSECTEETDAVADAAVQDPVVSLTSQPTPPHDGDNGDKSVGRTLVVVTDQTPSERAIAKEIEACPGPSKATADSATRLGDTTASLSSEPVEESGSDEQKDTDHTSAAQSIDRPLEEPEKVEKAGAKITPSKTKAKDPKVASHADAAQQSPQRVRVITPGYKPTKDGSSRPRCQGMAENHEQCTLEAKNCPDHEESNKYTTLQDALDSRDDSSLCQGVTKAKVLCRIKAHICSNHRDDRVLTEGDTFRERLSTLDFTRESKKLYFIDEREVKIELVQGWSAVSPARLNLRSQLLSKDLHPANPELEVPDEVMRCIDSFVERVNGKKECTVMLKFRCLF